MLSGMSDETLRTIALTKIGDARFKATNARGGETFMGTGGEDPDFTPVELLLAAIAGCSALDVEAITAEARRQHRLRGRGRGSQDPRRGRQPPRPGCGSPST